MMLVTILLGVIVVLLLVIIAMLVTGWPGKQREEMERLGNSLRREMAEQRSDSLQLMKSLRIVVEDAVKESVEKEIAAAAPRGRSRKGSRTKAQADNPAETPSSEEETPDDRNNETPLQAMQIPLFSEKPVTTQPSAANAASSEKANNTQPEPETIHMGYVDDIPDVE
jgi:FtsZ-interacting cell division protein ZipA